MKRLTLFEAYSPGHGGQYVYVGVRNAQITIGLSSDPARRTKRLGLMLLRVEHLETRRPKLELRRFRATRIDREWFMPTADVLIWRAEAATCRTIRPPKASVDQLERSSAHRVSERA